MITTLNRRTLSRSCACGLAGAALMLAGCANAGEGALTGAGLGSLIGMGLGSLGGQMGKGAAAGALIGGALGGWQGYQNEFWGSGGGDYYHGCHHWRD